MTLKEKVSQLIEYTKAHTIIQKRFNETGYTGGNKTSNGFFTNGFWTIAPLFDYENVTILTKLCYNNKVITEVYLKNTHNATTFNQAFYNCSALQRIETLDLTGCTSSASLSNMFYGCESLTRIRVCGVISIKFDIKYSPLDVESAKNIILHLKNYTDTEEAHTNTIYFADSVWELLDADGNTAPHGGTWRDYVFEVLCWTY